jgi:alkyl hydroperoxide reductase subunit AhpC/predicted ester cyclase
MGCTSSTPLNNNNLNATNNNNNIGEGGETASKTTSKGLLGSIADILAPESSLEHDDVISDDIADLALSNTNITSTFESTTGESSTEDQNMGGGGGNNGTTSPTPTPTTTSGIKKDNSNKREKKAIAAVKYVSQVHTLFCKGRLDDVVRLASEEITISLHATGQHFKGKAGFKEFMSVFKDAFPDISITHRSDISDGISVVSICTWSGTHTGVLKSQFGDIQPTGKRIENIPFTEIYMISGGKISKIENFQDTCIWFKQLGFSLFNDNSKSAISEPIHHTISKLAIVGNDMPNFDIEGGGGVFSKYYDYLTHKGGINGWGLLFSCARDSVGISELISAIKYSPELTKRNVVMCAISCETRENIVQWINDTMSITNNTSLTKDSITFPIICDDKKELVQSLGILDPVSKTHALNSVLVCSPDKKIKFVLSYPTSTGRNWDEIVRVIASLQRHHEKHINTPSNWIGAQDVFLSETITDEMSEEMFPGGNGIRIVTLPSGGKLRYVRDVGGV